ncbi:enoyl-CoA hydratase/isomerase family protein [Nocardia sp. NPDC050799]|uniref:enoyl-CoA hydratase/isomerase family protein n=1 Tax=Nocardia sp. NPDC050799 TaxID=3154842 RepID=UPI003401A5A6
MADLEYTITDGIATILLNRPHRKNAFTLEMLDHWAAALRSARTDPQVRVVLVTGADGAFCAGVDLDDFAEITSTLGRQEVLRDRVHRVAAAALDLDKPLIAAVDGVAVGAGMDMALACDIRLASTRARFSEAYVRVGLIPGDGGAHLLPRIVGQARALELLWTGRFVEAEEARALGLVLSLHDPAELSEAALALCRRLADGRRWRSAPSNASSATANESISRLRSRWSPPNRPSSNPPGTPPRRSRRSGRNAPRVSSVNEPAGPNPGRPNDVWTR